MKKLLPIIFCFLAFFFFFKQTSFARWVNTAQLDENCEEKLCEVDWWFCNEKTSRPIDCLYCTESEILTPSCATSFKVFDKVEYTKTGGNPIIKSWSGNITVDLNQVTIPFVGKEGEESEINYLADYLEGTNEYYGENYENQVIITNFQGILRKLTPFEYQNSVKKEIIGRVKNKEIHDYQIRYVGRVCWDAPLWVSGAKFVIEELGLNLPDINHYCIYEDAMDKPGQWLAIKLSKFGLIDILEIVKGVPGVFHITYTPGVSLTDISTLKPPPNPNDLSEKEYQEAFLEWKYKNKKDGDLTNSAKLWTVTPMLSREDSTGEIDPYLAPGQNPADSFEPKEPPEEPAIEAVPHVARLYEGSQIIHQILTPEGKEIEMFESEPIAKTMPPNACFIEKYIPTDNGDDLCCGPVTKTLIAWEEFKNPYYPCHYDLLDKETWHCIDRVSKEVSRGFGVNLQHPYLDEIWNYTAYADSAGFFNIFRPYDKEQFEDIAAADTVSYKYNPKGFQIEGEVSPNEGSFFFPHLGGVQKAKEWVVNQALWPYEEKQ